MDKISSNKMIFQRNELIWGSKVQDLLWNSSVAVFGLGGVGSFCVEALSRSGIGNLALVDNDIIVPSNLNRQLIATKDSLNKYKTEVIKERINAINSQINVITYTIFYKAAYNDEIFSKRPDFVIDAIDSVNSKVELISYCIKNNINIISSMGTGNRINPMDLFMGDISETVGNGCPLAKKVRLLLKKMGIEKGLQIVSSRELPFKPDYNNFIPSEYDTKEHPPGSNIFVPSVAGIYMANYVVRSIIESVSMK